MTSLEYRVYRSVLYEVEGQKRRWPACWRKLHYMREDDQSRFRVPTMIRHIRDTVS